MPRPSVVVHFSFKSSLPPSRTRGILAHSSALQCSLPEARTHSPDPSAFPFPIASGLFLTPPPYTPPLLEATPGSSRAHPPPLRHEADQRTHPAHPNCEWERRRDLQRRPDAGQNLPPILTCSHSDLHMNSPATRTTHALGSSFSSPPSSKIRASDWWERALCVLGTVACGLTLVPGSSEMNYNSQKTIQRPARAENPFLFGGKRRKIVAKPFGGCSSLGLNAHACPERVLDPARRWALGPQKEWLGMRLVVAGMGRGKFTLI